MQAGMYTFGVGYNLVFLASLNKHNIKYEFRWIGQVWMCVTIHSGQQIHLKICGKANPGEDLQFKSSKKLPLSQGQLADCCGQRSCWHEPQTGALLARGTLRSCAHLDAMTLPACLQGWRAGINGALGVGEKVRVKNTAGCKVCHRLDGEVTCFVWGNTFFLLILIFCTH